MLSLKSIKDVYSCGYLLTVNNDTDPVRVILTRIPDVAGSKRRRQSTATLLKRIYKLVPDAQCTVEPIRTLDDLPQFILNQLLEELEDYSVPIQLVLDGEQPYRIHIKSGRTLYRLIGWL